MWVKKNYIIISVLILGLALAIDFYWNPDGKVKLLSILSNLFYNAGLSLFILVSLEIGIDEILRKQGEEKEQFEREQHKSEIEALYIDVRENIFKGVFNRLIPEELVEIFSKEIIQQKVVRKNALWDYLISENNNGGYTLRHTTEYELHNITSFPIKEKIVISSETNSVHETKFIYFKIEHNGEKQKELTEEEISTTGTPSGILAEYEVDIEPGQYIKVIHRLLTKYNFMSIIDTHFANRSIIGLDIHFEKPKDCKITIIPSFSDIPHFTTIDNTSIRTTKSISGLLKGQCISFLIEKQPNIDQDNSKDVVSSSAAETKG